MIGSLIVQDEFLFLNFVLNFLNFNWFNYLCYKITKPGMRQIVVANEWSKAAWCIATE